MRGLAREFDIEKVPYSAKEKELIIMTELGYDEIATATSFVDYLCEKYGFSRSSIWYNLKRLKEKDVLDFAQKGETKPISLTRKGVGKLRNCVANHTLANRIPAQQIVHNQFVANASSIY